MAKKKGGRNWESSFRQSLGLSLFGIVLFLLAVPFFLEMGGGRWILAEVLPGQVVQNGGGIRQIFSGEERQAAVWGVDDVEFQQKSSNHLGSKGLPITAEVLKKMEDFSYLKSNFYIVDGRTAFLPTDIDVKEALTVDFSIETKTKEPKVLIFHTHAHEGFVDSDMSKGIEQGIWGVGEELKMILEKEYGIEVLHDRGQYDVVEGKGQILGAYERMEPEVRKILAKYPSIEVVIDMHRDGVAEGTKLVTEVDGKQCAKVMFFNGLCRLNKNGQLQPIDGLENPYLKENLAFSLQMQVAAGQSFPDFTRKIYLNAYRFSLHMLPRSTLIEVGAQTNTREEAANAMKPLAKVLAEVLLEKKG